jgi:hypothetical protein
VPPCDGDCGPRSLTRCSPDARAVQWCEVNDRRQRCAAGVLLLSLLVACDSMHMQRITVLPKQSPPTSETTNREVARKVLRQHGFRDMSTGREEWYGRKEGEPPGVWVRFAGEVELELRVSQDLHGPIGKTEMFRTIVKALTNALRARHGKASVHVD